MTCRTLAKDIAVVGAGTAGSAAALMLARGGRTVALLEKRALSAAGARWINGVPPWMFDQGGLPRPAGDEICRAGDPWVVIGPSGRALLELPAAPIWTVDVGRLNDRLHLLARQSGVRTFEHVRIQRLVLDHGRPVALSARLAPLDGPESELEIRARLFVDASGQAGTLRLRVPELARDCPPVPVEHLCTAAQQVCAIDDRAGAEAFVRRHRSRPGDVLMFAGLEGGWSTLNIQVDEDFNTVDLLSGCIADGRHASGPEMLSACKRTESWIGEKRSGGQGLVPLRRPYDRLAAPGIALVGESGCMVFSLHGSGTGPAVLAARILAEAVGEAGDPGALEVTWAFQSEFHRQLGCLHAASDVLRRFMQQLSAKDVERLLESGLMQAGTFIAGLDQRLPGPGDIEPGRLLAAIGRAPWLATRLAPAFVRLVAVHAAYKAHPRRPDFRALRLWSRTVARLVGDPPDVR